MADLLEKSASGLLGAIAAGTTSAVEAMSACLGRIEAANPELNAVVSLRDPDELMSAAEAADRVPPENRGPLHGLPMAVKDLVRTAGIRTTLGSPIFADDVPAADDILAARLRAAGAILIGKTNVPEFGMGSQSFNPIFGATRNPYDRTKTAGGSSGGAAVALATRMTWLADGSDAMGSLRNPAGWNNVYSLRPSLRAVPAEPQGEMFLDQLSTDGPMARCPEDLALLLQVMAGPDPRVPGTRTLDPLPLTAEVSDRRIGWLADWDGALPMEPGILEQCRAALDIFVEAGCAVEPVAAPYPREALWESWTTLRSFLAAGKFGPLYDAPEKRALLKPEAVWEIERGRALSAADICRASALRSEWYRRVADLAGTYDAFAMPTAQLWPFDADMRWPEEIAGISMDTYHRWMEIVVPVSLAGLPAATVPAGFGETGLSIGLQLFGLRGGDYSLLQLAQAYHQRANWPEKAPPPI